MRTAIAIAFCLTSGAAVAADTCIETLPEHRSGYWHYRYVNHQKCWFGPGAEKIARRDPEHKMLERRRIPAAPHTAPVPIESVAANIEEEKDEPIEPTVKRVRVIPFTIPPSPSRMIQRYFDELDDRCQVSVTACEDFLR